MVSDQADVGQRPAKDVGQDEDGDILRIACYVGLCVVECGLLARGTAIPLEAGLAVLTGHLGRIDSGWRCRLLKRAIAVVTRMILQLRAFLVT